MANNSGNAFGRLCEDRAVEYLLHEGYEIIERNIRLGRGEIDVIAVSESILCFIEIKASSSETFGSPIERVTVSKQRQLKKLAAMYLKLHPHLRHTLDVRFDVILIVSQSTRKNSPFEIEHIPDAFR